MRFIVFLSVILFLAVYASGNIHVSVDVDIGQEHQSVEEHEQNSNSTEEEVSPTQPIKKLQQLVVGATAPSSLGSGQTLSGGQCLTSSATIFGSFRACMQTDGNLVVYNAASKPLFNTGTNGKAAGPYALVNQGDHNLVIYAAGGKVLWSAGTNGKGSSPTTLIMQADGNLVLYSGSTPLWNSFAAGGSNGNGNGIAPGNGVHYGVDVSAYQTVTDHAAVVAHLKAMGGGSTPFCFVKSTEGSSYVYSAAPTHVAAFQQAGCLTGIYHFFHVSSGVTAQLNLIMGHLAGAKYVMIDSELGDAGAGPATLQLIRALQARGIRPLLYTAGWLASSWGAESWGVPIWIAAYGSSPSVRADLWQYSSTASIPGIAGNVDIDKTMCNEARFQQIFY